jgi:hypothetical protein
MDELVKDIFLIRAVVGAARPDIAFFEKVKVKVLAQ